MDKSFIEESLQTLDGLIAASDATKGSGSPSLKEAAERLYITQKHLDGSCEVKIAETKPKESQPPFFSIPLEASNTLSTDVTIPKDNIKRRVKRIFNELGGDLNSHLEKKFASFNVIPITKRVDFSFLKAGSHYTTLLDVMQEETDRQSSSMRRAPDSQKAYVRARTGPRNTPFTPGGVVANENASVSQDVSSILNEFTNDKAIETSLRGLRGHKDALITHPNGLPRGITQATRDINAKVCPPDVDTEIDIAEDEMMVDANGDDIREKTNEEKINERVERRQRLERIAEDLEQVNYWTMHEVEDIPSARYGEDKSEMKEDPDIELSDQIGYAVPVIAHESGFEANVNAENVEEMADELLRITTKTSEILNNQLKQSAAKTELGYLKENQTNGGLDDTWAIFDSSDTSNFHVEVPEMAKEYDFELDDFQKQAVLHLERGESVFVAAHTSAGKTVVAEYAIGLALLHRTRVIYTSPIKALSNQKFRDFQKTFSKEDIGLITGDVSINPTGSCLVMTTEILRSMLYRGADIIRDIEWVVFDEVHYINDLERGVVWEEVIIMLPSHVNLIFLSATTPNTLEFSSWIGRTKRRKVYVISTTKRPVPLEHFIFAGNKNHKILDQKGKFISDGYTSARRALQSLKEKRKEDSSTAKANKANARREQANQSSKWKHSGSSYAANVKTANAYWLKMIKELLVKNELTPAVVFAFSKRKCDERAASLDSLDLTTAKEKSQAHLVFKQALSRLSGSDRSLPQVLRLQDLVNRGLAVHHGGLLPILKEVVEILFARGLVKVLFATETFAIGVNMPARAVIFQGLRKHDGIRFRDLLPGEYTQMAGRAGRRGLDSVGTVIIAADGGELPPIQTLSTMMTGKATKLSSQFRLSYNLILNLLRVAEMSVSEMMKRSFSEFSAQRMLGEKDMITLISRGESKLKKIKEALKDPCVLGGGSAIEEYQKAVDDAQKRLYFLVSCILNGEFGRKATSTMFCNGRIVLFNKTGRVVTDDLISNQVELFCPARVLSFDNNDKLLFVETISYGEVAIPLSSIFLISREKASSIDSLRETVSKHNISFDDRCQTNAHRDIDIEDEGNFIGTGANMINTTIDPVSDLKIGDIDFVLEWKKCVRDIADRIFESKCHTCVKMKDKYLKYEKVNVLQSRIQEAKIAISDENLALFPDSKARVGVLKKLGYISREDMVVSLKGRVSSEINTCDELLLTEIIFENLLGNLDPAEVVAILSALVLQGKSKDEPFLNENLERARRNVLHVASNLEALQKRYRVEMDPDWLSKCLNFGLMEVVYEWARGMPFRDICNLTTMEEGSVVRCINRLEETCREVRTIAQVIGDASLYLKMEKASEAIKRDIIFATSLYLG